MLPLARSSLLAGRMVSRQAFQTRLASTSSNTLRQTPFSSSAAVMAAGAGIATAMGIAYLQANPAQAHTETADTGVHSPEYPWVHHHPLKTFDHAAIRRGYQVYKEVCAACHSLDRISFRNLVDVSHTQEEVKALAEEFEYQDGPNDEGLMFTRPGKPADYFPRPYANDEAGRAANGGALPPDLSLVVKARHGGEDYIFSLLTGYVDPPAGVEIREGLNYNPYFPGGAISMARTLFDGVVEYEDGTPATTSQMAKDVTEFLAWAAEPEHDDRKRLGLKAVIILSVLTGLSVWLKRFKWANLKNRKFRFTPPK